MQAPLPQVEQLHDDVMIYGFMPGIPLTEDAWLRLDAASQDGIAEQLALFMGQMHRIPRAALAQHGLALSAAAWVTEDWERLYQDVERELCPHLMAHQRAWITRQFAPVRAGELTLAPEPVLIHGDLAAYHILHDLVHGSLTGILDVGCGRWGDLATDYACLIQTLGERVPRRMMRHNPMIRAALDRARWS